MKGTKKQGKPVDVDPPIDPNAANATDSSEDAMTVPELLAEETNDSELNTLEEELESEEQQAENADEAETEALESEGFVEGTSPLGSDGDDGEDEFEPQIEVSSATTQPGEPILGGADVSVLTSNGEVMASASGWGGSKPKSSSSSEESIEDADMAGNTTVVEDGDGFLSGDDNSTDVMLTNVTFNDAEPEIAVSNANATEGEWPSVSELLAQETNDADLDELEEELEEEEEEAEKEDEEEDEELESEGFVMGTDPIENEDDDIEPQIDVEFSDGDAMGNGTDVSGTANHTDTDISSNTTKAPVDGEGIGDDDGNGDDGDDDGAIEDDDQGEQGKITDDDDDGEEDDDDSSETTDDDKQDDDGESTDDDDSQGTPEGKDDDGEVVTDDDQQATQVGSKDDDDDGTGSSISDTTGSSPTAVKTSAPSKNKHYTKPPRPSHSKPSSPPMSLPPQTPQTLTSSPGAPTLAPASDSCVGFMCNSHGHVLPILGLLAFVPLFMIYCWRRYCSAKVDTRGEYRAVAAQYGDVFSDDISDDEADFGDVEDSWGKSGKRTLELSSISQERNGGLSLAEMNG